MRLRALLLALLAGATSGVGAQPDCPGAGEVTAAGLLGLWRADLDGKGHGATLLLEPHPLYAESVHGTINRGGERRQLAGDVDAGELTLEESADGVHIAATWLGDIVEGSCGKEIRGTWQAEGEGAGHAFVLRKE